MDDLSLVDGLWPSIDRFVAPDVLREVGAHAAAADGEGQLSQAGLAALRRVGWPGLAVPVKFGGLGATLLECCAVQRRLGSVDPGLAIACTMHLGCMGVWVEHYRKHPDMTWVFMEAVAKQGLLVASAVAEPGLGGTVARSTLRARRVEGGWEITGRKSPLSFTEQASLIVLQFQTEASADQVSEFLVAVVPRSLPGISVKRTWNTLGMRGSGSDTLELTRCVVPDPLVVYRSVPGADEDRDMLAGIIWFSLVITATYLGLAEAALAQARSILIRMAVPHLESPRADLPSYQNSIGEALAGILCLEASCAGLCARMDGGTDPRGVICAALALKQHAIRVVPSFVTTLAECCGGAAYTRTLPLERLWRDAQAVHFHPPTPAQVSQYLGRRGLGVRAMLELDEISPRLREARRAAEGRPAQVDDGDGRHVAATALSAASS